MVPVGFFNERTKMYQNLEFQIIQDFASFPASRGDFSKHFTICRPQGGHDILTRKRADGLLELVKDAVEDLDRTTSREVCSKLGFLDSRGERSSIGFCLSELGWTRIKFKTRAERKNGGGFYWKRAKV